MRPVIEELGKRIDEHLYNEMSLIDLIHSSGINEEEMQWLQKRMFEHPHVAKNCTNIEELRHVVDTIEETLHDRVT